MKSSIKRGVKLIYYYIIDITDPGSEACFAPDSRQHLTLAST